MLSSKSGLEQVSPAQNRSGLGMLARQSVEQAQNSCLARPSQASLHALTSVSTSASPCRGGQRSDTHRVHAAVAAAAARRPPVATWLSQICPASRHGPVQHEPCRQKPQISPVQAHSWLAALPHPRCPPLGRAALACLPLAPRAPSRRLPCHVRDSILLPRCHKLQTWCTPQPPRILLL